MRRKNMKIKNNKVTEKWGSWLRQMPLEGKEIHLVTLNEFDKYFETYNYYGITEGEIETPQDLLPFMNDLYLGIYDPEIDEMKPLEIELIG